MKCSEFKVWLDGFSEEVNGVPTLTQWQQINLRLKTVNDHMPFGDKKELRNSKYFADVPYEVGREEASETA